MNLKKPLKKCSKKGKIFGVCAGISKWCEIDVSIIRILFALSILFTKIEQEFKIAPEKVVKILNEIDTTQSNNISTK